MKLRKEDGGINWGNFTLSILILLFTIAGIIYGAGATLATKADVRELKQERVVWSTEHERQNREDMKEIRQMFQTILDRNE
jgi:hypothetical protein